MMEQRREYCYIGSSQFRDLTPQNIRRVQVRSADEVRQWITNQPREVDGTVVATFIVDTDGELWINDRRSEHVWCAAGRNVLSAGEMTFELRGQGIEVVEVTNQSTGYCPEPESWGTVEKTLENAKIPHPSDFTMRFLFRRCDQCGTTNIVKDEWFVCGVCDAPLSQTWNFADSGDAQDDSERRA
jgi:hypothetical protein